MMVVTPKFNKPAAPSRLRLGCRSKIIGAGSLIRSVGPTMRRPFVRSHLPLCLHRVACGAFGRPVGKDFDVSTRVGK